MAALRYGGPVPAWAGLLGLCVTDNYRCTGVKSPQRELSLPWNFRSVEHLLLGTFAPVELSFLGSECSKNFRSYETVIP